ncbi:formate dehydrogenase accessory sulfurtransferase FdhD [Bacillota bacterium LX-D]|nr:formate dehydrogenase accessory sulfurtransferase FdhD [Bacillota bacterium LX-D]
MLTHTSKIPIEKIIKHERFTIEDTVVDEYPFTIHVNGLELVTLLCSPANLEYLGIGFLQSEGFIIDKSCIEKVEYDQKTGYFNVLLPFATKIFQEKAIGKRTLTTGCGKGTTFNQDLSWLESQPITTEIYISTQQVYDFVNEMQQKSQTFKETGAAHISTLASTTKILYVHEDIGRHNALDKLFGECILNEVGYGDKIIVTSGRISSEMLIKCAKRRIPILISRSAATGLAIELAQKMGITLIGFVRGNRMNIYANGWRIVNNN